mmetsp:Transcript_24694/g.69105  ORF Transcript_24694/g.69105 Transcript_24694/m.69105 type:complete len:208 (+) Transcript_24694:842-1465(+)
MLASVSAMCFSRDFFLSSEVSSSVLQYSFLLSSSSCSFFRVATISSIMAMTFSKPIFLPLSAYSIKATMELPEPALADACCKIARARDRTDAALMRISTKLALAPGSVFLNNSRASSSLRILMVSASASSSSARTLQRASHSAVFVAHPFSSSARNFSSCAFDSAVSSLSFFISAMDTASSPLLWSFVSIALVRALTSSVLAPMRAL